MTKKGSGVQTSDWLAAFPIRQAGAAVDALCESWSVLTATPKKSFHAKMREPELTKALKTHVERVTAPKAGLLGMWVAESVINTMDFDTGALTEERRNDIVYGWNDDQTQIQLVFECKKLTKAAKSRNAYIGGDGLGRFVTGIYSHQQPVAAMVGMLVDPAAKVVPPIKKALGQPEVTKALAIVAGAKGESCRSPSSLFPPAEFDTVHTRPPALAPTHGTIQVAHVFLPFS